MNPLAEAARRAAYPCTLRRPPTLRAGDRAGVLLVTLGGCMTLLTSSIGTDSSWSARGGILLIEEESEDDYRIDRMLVQLRRSRYLDDVAGVVTGTFVGCGERDAIEAILRERLGDLGVPVLARANAGPLLVPATSAAGREPRP